MSVFLSRFANVTKTMEAGEKVTNAVERGVDKVGKIVLSVIEALIAAGANPNARLKSGWTPLHAAVSDNTDPSVIRALIAGGENQNARDVSGSTPLYLADDRPSVIKALIEAGADVNARDKDGKTPFDYAKDNKALQGTDVYWRLNQARFK